MRSQRDAAVPAGKFRSIADGVIIWCDIVTSRQDISKKRKAELESLRGRVADVPAGPGVYRVRVGNYRVIYTVRDDQQHVIVARVARRSGSTYRGLS